MTRQRLSPEQRSRELVSAAIELYSRRPFEQVSVDDIAAAAGVSRALFYRYFTSPWDVFLTGARVVVDGLIDRLTAPSHGTLRQQLRRAVGEFVAFAEQHGPAFAAMLRNGAVMAGADTTALVEEVREATVTEIARRAGVPLPRPLSLLTMRCWMAVVEESTLSWLTERQLSRDELADWLTSQFFAMMATTATIEPELATALDRFGPTLFD